MHQTNKAPRIALGGILIECNQLGGRPTELADFERTELRRGQEILSSTTGVVGGMLQVLRQRGAEIVPLLYASSIPGGALTSGCYAQLKGPILEALTAALPVDGVLLPLHGSAAAQGADGQVMHLEDDLLLAVRDLVGPGLPIVVTLDLHAHATGTMVQCADALLAWATYPHRDTYSTGQRGANLLMDAVTGRCSPTMALGKVPVLVGGVRGSTEGDDPFADIMRFAKGHEGKNGVLSTSVLLVHPYLDLPEMGGGGVVVTDGDSVGAARLANEIAQRYWERRYDLEPEVWTPEQAIIRGLAVEGGPVLLVETADCSGGGASGDSVHTLRALLEADVREPFLAPVVDPAAAAMCWQAGMGRQVRCPLGFSIDPRWGQPLAVEGRVEALSEGHFRYGGGVWEGQEGNMGPSALLQVGAGRVLVTTHSSYDWADEQYASLRLDVRRFKFVVAKNPMNYRLGYGAIARAAIILDTPGPTPATLRHVRYENMQRPYFPLDPEIPGLAPRVWVRE
jgi:microcystin degradation protein MlrC